MSLYRKYRPQTFEDVVGQEHIAQTLRNALSTDPPRIAHAYLFCGPRGTGKTTSARLLAKCLNCEKGPSPIPCNECDFCTRVRDNQSVMDLVEIDAASNTGVDKVREHIIEKVSMAPAQGRYRIYIIDEVHMLSTSAFNALLKTLEEPPPHAIFVLATTDAHKVPTTITSRCQRFDFRRVGPADIVGRLQYVAKNEGFGLEDNAARLIALQADGALRDSLTLLEQVSAFSAETITEADVRLVLGTVSHELLQSLIDAVARRDPASALADIDRATEEGVSFSQLTRDLTNYCRDLLLLTVGFESNALLPESDKKRRLEQAKQLGRARLLPCVEALRATEKEMRQSTDHRLLLELALVRATNEEAPVARMAAPAGAPVAAPAASRPAPPRQTAAPPASAPPAAAPRPLPPTPVSSAGDTVEPVAAQAPVEAGMSQPSVQAEDGGVGSEASDAWSDEAAPLSEQSVTVAPSAKKGRRIHDLGEFVELWPAVLARVKRKIGVTAVAYLHDAYPVALDDKQATLEFKKEFHYEKACEALKRLPFEQVVNECMATPHILRFQMAPPPAKRVVIEEPAAPVITDDFDENDDILRLAQDMFAAEVVGRSGDG